MDRQSAVARDGAAPHLVQQLPFFDDPPPVGHKVGKQVELHRRELDLRAVDAHPGGFEVDGEPSVVVDAGLTPARGARGRPRQSPPHLRHEEGQRIGFDDVIVPSQRQGENLIVFARARRNEDDRGVSVFAKPAAELESAGPRKVDVQQYEPRIQFRHGREGFLGAAHRAGLDLRQIEVLDRRGRKRRFVFDHQHIDLLRHSSTLKPRGEPGQGAQLADRRRHSRRDSTARHCRRASNLRLHPSRGDSTLSSAAVERSYLDSPVMTKSTIAPK